MNHIHNSDTQDRLDNIDVIATKILIYRTRISKDLSAAKVARHCGVSRQGVSKWESMDNNSLPTINNFLALERLYQMDIGQLIVRKYPSDGNQKPGIRRS